MQERIRPQEAVYDVFPGVRLIYSQENTLGAELHDGLRIDYGCEGVMEYASGEQSLLLSAGDVMVSRGDGGAGRALSERFRGLRWEIDLPRAEQSMAPILHDQEIDWHTLREAYCGEGRRTLFRANGALLSLFETLYDAPPEVRLGYGKTKMAELLFWLKALQNEAGVPGRRRRFSKYAVAQSRAAAHYLREQTGQAATVADLARRFGVSQTVLKECFRSLYGESVAAYSRRLRMEKAAELLLNTDVNILEVAMQVGYSNASKFARAFQATMGCTPKAYRRKMG